MFTVNSGMNPSVNTSQVLVQPLTQPGLWFASVNEILSAPGMTEEGGEHLLQIRFLYRQQGTSQ